ncbi:TetR/AcrR family transcriptional regulator [Rhodococcus opacus]|uniref:TetR/AcrR family transcriptional regulator n=1 Tax=Rhodococcus opacus TaxID=37919 RepID=UPI0011C3C132|nr:TetR/AcrR family transcriptional regulator [Rhodococcus opacus]
MPGRNPARGTAQQIRDTAAAEFSRLGYCKTTIPGIAEALQLAKGAVYFHYPSKVSLARAVVEEGARQLAALCKGALAARSPAFKALIDISFVVAGTDGRNTLIQSAFRLSAEVGDCLGNTPTILTTLPAVTGDLVRRATSQGDLRDDADPDDVARLVVDMSYGVCHLTTGAPCSSVHTQCWSLLLPGLVDGNQVEYFRQFVARKTRTAATYANSPGSESREENSVSLTFLCERASMNRRRRE